MTPPKPSLLDLQINRANRRLFLQAFVNRLSGIILIAALLAALIWFLIEPFLFEAPLVWQKWAVVGGLLGSAALTALVLTWLRAPSRLSAALLIDERFNLKERVTTSLALTPQEQASPAGQALLEDLQQRIGNLDVPSRFSIRLSWLALLVPATAAVLVLIALFYDPPRLPTNARKVDPLQQPPGNAAEITQSMEKLKRKVLDLQQPERDKSEKLKEIEAEMERIAQRPRDTQEQVRERVREMTALEEKVRDQQQELADRSKALKQQLQELNRLADRTSKDGPANDLQKALAEGNLDKAKDEMDKLAKKLEQNQLNEKEKELLQKQLQNLKDRAEHLAREQKEREQRLEKLIKEAKAEGRDTEALQRELDQLRQQGQNLEKLQDLAQKLDACQNCLAKGDKREAAGKLREAQQQLKELNLSEQQMKDLQDQLDRLQEVKEVCGKGYKGNGDQGDGEPGDGLGQGTRGVGRRPKGKPHDYRSFNARQKADFDPGKRIYLDGLAPGQNFKAKSGPEIAGEIKQATQEAPEAMEQQRIPKAKRDIAKDYYRNLGGQAEKAKN